MHIVARAASLRVFTSTTLALLIGCSSRSHETSSSAGAPVRSAAVEERSDAAKGVLDRAVAIVHRGAPSLAAFLAPNRDKGFLPRDDGFSSYGFRAADQRVFEHLGAHLPQLANGAIDVGPSRFERFRLRLVPIASAAVPGTAHEGRVVYRDAYPATDVIAVTTAQTFEELFVLRDATAPKTFAWDVQLPRGVRSVRFEDTGALVFADARGEGLLRMPKPFAVDAAGVRRDAELAWDGHRISVHLDATALVYPIVLDPALEQFIWEKKTPAKAPSARHSVAMAYDSDRKVMVLYGGDSSATTITPIADTWEYDGTNWTQKCGAPLAACALPALSRHAMAYHAPSKKTFLHGVEGLVSQRGLWDGSTWSVQTWAYAAATAPFVRWNQAIAFDSMRGNVVQSGGSVGFGGADDTPVWNGSVYSDYSTNLNCPGNAPYCRWDHAMAYHAASDRIVMFSGFKDGIGASDDTWLYNPALKQWSSVLPSSRPGPREGHRMAYVPARQRTVLFGGNLSDETWEWNGTLWSLATPMTKPSGRRNFAFAMDTARGRLVLFGGQVSSGATGGTTWVPNGETWEMHARGGGCTTNAQCDTGSCVDGVCCETSSCGTCQRCDGATPGTCSAVVLADDDTCKAPNATCNGTGQCKKLQGQACGGATECLTGFCVDSVCCASACGENCQACAAEVKESGADDGVCGPAKNGTNPHADCTKGFGGACGQTGACDGTGTCKIELAGVSCGTGVVCDGNVAKGQQCDGLGACANNAAGSDCNEAKCTAPAGCVSACAADVDCSSTGWCDKSVTPAICKPKKKNGDTCAAGAECQNPFCVDGVCCNKPCAGQCEACTSTGAVGTCVPISGTPVAPRAACASAPAGAPCQARTCDGVDGAKCAGFISADATCRTAACTDGEAVTELHCDGKGNCPSDAPKVCAPYVCGNTTCKDACTDDGDCLAPTTCDKTAGRCVAAAKCDGDHTTTSADGKVTVDCSPYRCDASGQCKTTCATSDDCVSPSLCGVGVCTPPPAGEPEDSGGCAFATTGRASGAGMMMGLVMLAAARRRSARAQPRRS